MEFKPSVYAVFYLLNWVLYYYKFIILFVRNRKKWFPPKGKESIVGFNLIFFFIIYKMLCNKSRLLNCVIEMDPIKTCLPLILEKKKNKNIFWMIWCDCFMFNNIQIYFSFQVTEQKCLRAKKLVTRLLHISWKLFCLSVRLICEKRIFIGRFLMYKSFFFFFSEQTHAGSP